MTSPVGHSLGAYIVAGKGVHDLSSRQSIRAMVGSLALIVFAGNAPDLDFLLGWALGDFNAYHHRASHSVFAMMLFSFIVWLITRRFNMHALAFAVMAALAYASHLVLDLLTQDSAAPFGLQIFWPISQQFYLAPQAVFSKIEHGSMNATTTEAFSSIFSMHNLSAIGLEIAVLGPIALIVYWRRQHPRISS